MHTHSIAQDLFITSDGHAALIGEVRTFVCAEGAGEAKGAGSRRQIGEALATFLRGSGERLSADEIGELLIDIGGGPMSLYSARKGPVVG